MKTTVDDHSGGRMKRRIGYFFDGVAASQPYTREIVTGLRLHRQPWMHRRREASEARNVSGVTTMQWMPQKLYHGQPK